MAKLKIFNKERDIQGDQKCWKKSPNFFKVAQKVSKPKNAKIFMTNLKLKVQNIKPLLKP